MQKEHELISAAMYWGVGEANDDQDSDDDQADVQESVIQN